MIRSGLPILALLPVLLWSTLAAVAPRVAAADSNTRSALITLAPLSPATKVELDALIVDADILDNGDHTMLSGQLTFRLHNTDRLTPTEIMVGFPSWGGGAEVLDENSFSQFVITINGDPVQPQWQNAPIKLANETRTVRWLAFPVQLAEDEIVTVQATFKQDAGDGTLPTVVFAQAPAILWKGYVGSARYSFHFPSLTTAEQFRSVTPGGSSFDGKSLTWLYEQFNPDVPIVLQLIRPQLWHDIVQARSDLAHGDPKAALSLGALYTQLARASQGEGDFSLAVAAYQQAADLDPTSPAGPLAIAKLYEAKLHGDFGKPADETALRAAALDQWQRVLKLSPGSGEAVDAVAQHALALAQLARRASRFDAALAWLGIARNTGSATAPAATLDGEARADRAGSALQQIDAGQWPEAVKQIQTDGFSAEAANELTSLMPRFTGIQVRTAFEADRQTFEARLIPFPATSPQHEKLLNDWLAAVRRLQGADGTLEVDGDVYVLTLHLPAAALAASGLPSAGETLMLREILAPPELRIAHSNELLTVADTFDARYALTDSQQTAQSKVNDADRSLKALGTPAADETQELVRRLRVRALEQYRAGWQSLLDASSVHVSWTSGSAVFGKPEQWDLRTGDTQMLQASRTMYQPWFIAGAGVCGVGTLAAAALGTLIVWTRRRHRATALPR